MVPCAVHTVSGRHPYICTLNPGLVYGMCLRNYVLKVYAAFVVAQMGCLQSFWHLYTPYLFQESYPVDPDGDFDAVYAA